MNKFEDKYFYLEFVILVFTLFIHAYMKLDELETSYTYNISCLSFGISYWILSIIRIYSSFKKTNYFFSKVQIIKNWDICLYGGFIFISFSFVPFLKLFDFKMTESEGVVSLVLLCCSLFALRFLFSSLGIAKSVKVLHAEENSGKKMAA